MSNKFKNKYRIPTSRLKNWDYGNNGAYFITICTKKRTHFFGEIVSVDGENVMNINEIGKLAILFWEEIPKHFPFVELGNFQIMPNHVHGILIINKLVGVETLHCNVSNNIVETLQCNVSTEKNHQMSNILPKSGSISTIIRSYKSVVSKHSHYIDSNFKWQERFFDNIIKDSISFDNIQNYIENNVENWKEDQFYL